MSLSIIIVHLEKDSFCTLTNIKIPFNQRSPETI